jgi:putative endonuclease
MFARESALDDARADLERVHGSGRVEGSKGQTPAPGTSPCFVYILLCADNSYYVGCTTDLATRERIHNEGHGAEHTAAHRPVRLVYSEAHETWRAARKREAQLKRWTREKKEASSLETDRACTPSPGGVGGPEESFSPAAWR